MLVVRAAGLSARSFGGHDLVALLDRHRRADGSIAGQVNLTSFGVMALRAASVPAGRRTYAWLVSQQNHDGGFGFTGGAPSDPDDTGAALEALAGVSGLGGPRARAVAYLRAAQNHDGGYPASGGQTSNAQSTAWAIQGLDAAGVAASSLHRRGAVSPLNYLRGLIAPDGSVHYSHGLQQTPVWVSAEALMALEGKPLPLAAVPAPGATTAATTTAAKRPAAATRSRTAPRARSGSAANHANPVRARRTKPRSGAPVLANGSVASLMAGVGFVTALALAPLNLP
jgi:hypothetical protein